MTSFSLNIVIVIKVIIYHMIQMCDLTHIIRYVLPNPRVGKSWAMALLFESVRNNMHTVLKVLQDMSIILGSLNRRLSRNC